MIKPFNKIAHQYDSVTLLRDLVAHDMFSNLKLMNFKPNIILDIGCATGSFTKKLSKIYKKAQVIGIDSSPNMLKIASKKSNLRRKYQYVNAQAERLPFPDNSVDFVFSYFTFHWCESLEMLFTELKRVLRPNGLIFFSMPGPSTLQELRQAWSQIDNYDHVNQFADMHDLGDELVKAGFADPVMQSHKDIFDYPNVMSLLKDIKAIGSHVNLLNKKLTLTSPKTLQRLEQLYPHTDSYPVSCEIIYGHAWCSEDSNGFKADKSGEVRVPISKIIK